VQEFVAPVAGEAVYIKHVNSSFIGTTQEILAKLERT